MNKEEKLDINHVKHYLGTGVQIRWSNHIIKTSTLDHSNIDVLLYHSYHKMLLHPLDRLTEPILEDGVTPIEWIKKRWGYEVFEYVGYQRYAYMFKLGNNTPAILHLPFCFIEKFLEWHFDIFGLIPKGLALPIDPN